MVGNSPCAAFPVQLQGRVVSSTTARATDALEPGFLCDGVQSSWSPVGLRLVSTAVAPLGAGCGVDRLPASKPHKGAYPRDLAVASSPRQPQPQSPGGLCFLALCCWGQPPRKEAGMTWVKLCRSWCSQKSLQAVFAESQRQNTESPAEAPRPLLS